MSVRVYGQIPYQAAVIHAGPGIPGAGAGLARELSEFYGVIEPLQTKYSVEEQIEELDQQLGRFSKQPIVLIGHGWGAWLAVMYTAKYPKLVKKLVLIGTSPLMKYYIEEMSYKRKYHFTKKQLHQYDDILNKLMNPDYTKKDIALNEISSLCKISDEYQPFIVEDDMRDIVAVDGEMYYRIVTEAKQYLESGYLMACFKKLTCPLCIMHGKYDIHPVQGVIEPLLVNQVEHRLSLIDNCGHTPWREKFAYEDFYRALKYEIET